MSAVERFKELAAEPRFKGWPVVGQPMLTGKIPFFGQLLEYDLETGNGVEHYASIIRHFGWSVVLGITQDLNVVTIAQWKPGVNCASWELPPGGIGKIAPDATPEEILAKTQEVYLRETGYGGGKWSYLGHIMIETGKYRGAGPDDHGLPAHMFLASRLELRAEARKPNPNEIMETLVFPLNQLPEVVRSGEFVEASALPCALLAMEKLGILNYAV